MTTALQVNADASLSQMPRTAIDPTLLPLPDDDDNEYFPDFQSLLKQAAKPATKVAGSRRLSSKARDKQRAVDEIAAGKSKCKMSAHPNEPASKKSRGGHAAGEDIDKAAPKKGHRGCLPGVANFSKEDLEIAMNILEELCPLGSKAWNTTMDIFNEHVRAIGRPVRTAKSLKNKFKQVC